jgi:hypothetical protein
LAYEDQGAASDRADGLLNSWRHRTWAHENYSRGFQQHKLRLD